jgi:mannose/fructose-specific phosphotransferase system component IIA
MGNHLGTIIALSASAISALVSTILSSIAAEAASQKNASRAHSYSRWSAVISGLSLFLGLLAILIISQSGKIAEVASNTLASLNDQVSALQQQLKAYSSSK